MISYCQHRTDKEVKRPTQLSLKADQVINPLTNHHLEINWNGLLHVQKVNVAQTQSQSLYGKNT